MCCTAWFAAVAWLRGIQYIVLTGSLPVDKLCSHVALKATKNRAENLANKSDVRQKAKIVERVSTEQYRDIANNTFGGCADVEASFKASRTLMECYLARAMISRGVTLRSLTYAAIQSFPYYGNPTDLLDETVYAMVFTSNRLKGTTANVECSFAVYRHKDASLCPIAWLACTAFIQQTATIGCHLPTGHPDVFDPQHPWRKWRVSVFF